jgi:hypothetical protein
MMSVFHRLFPKRPPIIAVIHLRPLPGSPRWDGDWKAVEEAARRDATALVEANADGLIVENFGDAPFFASRVEPVTVAAMTMLTHSVREEIRFSVPVGVNVLRNDALAAVSVAAVTGADFVRVNVHAGVMVADQGILEGRAAETLRERTRLGAKTLLFADVWVKHATPLGLTARLEELAEDTYRRGLADALILTGGGTGKPASLDDAKTVRHAVPDAPLLIGSGVTRESLGETLQVADGVIVGTALKKDGLVTNPVDAERARAFFTGRPPCRK